MYIHHLSICSFEENPVQFLVPSAKRHDLFFFLSLVLCAAFRYQKTQYDVFEVNQTGYDNCTTEGALGNWTSGKDFILLDKAKRYYFIGGNGQCFNGMKVSVFVRPLAPPSGSVSAANQTSPNAAAHLDSHNGLLLFRALVVALASLWFGSGWI